MTNTLTKTAQAILALYSPGVAFTVQQAITRLGEAGIEVNNPDVVEAREELRDAGLAKVDMQRGFVLLPRTPRQRKAE